MSQVQASYQTNQQTPAAVPVNLQTEYPQIPADDVREVLDALMVVRNSTGWGRIEFIILASSIEDTNIHITKKRRPKKAESEK